MKSFKQFVTEAKKKVINKPVTDAYTDEHGVHHDKCYVCHDWCSTHHDANNPLSYCGDCNKPTCPDHRDLNDSVASRCLNCANKHKLTESIILSEGELSGTTLKYTGHGGNWHSWDIHHPQYGKLGSVDLIHHTQPLHKAKTAKLDVSTVENDNIPNHLRDGETSEGPKYKLGAGNVKHLLHHIKKFVHTAYPNIETLESERTTGIKANTGQTAKINLKK